VDCSWKIPLSDFEKMVSKPPEPEGWRSTQHDNRLAMNQRLPMAAVTTDCVVFSWGGAVLSKREGSVATQQQ
jgi:hypothetical protein